MPGADPGAEIEDVGRWDPRLWQPTDQQQLAEMPGVGPVGLRPLLLAFQRAGLGWLSEVHVGTGSLELLDHEPPAGRCFQRDLQTLAPERLKERADPGTVRRHDPGTRDLRGHRVDPLRRDLRPMLIKSHHDRHAITTRSSTPASLTTPTRSAKRAGLRIPWTTVGTSSSIGRPRGRYPRAPTAPFDVEGRPPSPPGSRLPGHDIFARGRLGRTADGGLTGFYEPGLVGKYDGLDAIAEVELHEDSPDVRLDGAVGDYEMIGDFSVG